MSDFFSIFNPEWWMDENNNALLMTDAILFLLFAIPVVYLFIYALASIGKYKNPYPDAQKKHKFLVLFVVLRNGKEVINSIFSILSFILEKSMTLLSQQLSYRKKIWLPYFKCQSTL